MHHRPLIVSTDVANCMVKEMTTEWIIYIILIVAALTVGSGLCNLFYYTCYGHPWEVYTYVGPGLFDLVGNSAYPAKTQLIDFPKNRCARVFYVN